jgi:hypothetical protein
MAMTTDFLTEQAELEYEEFTLFSPGVTGVDISARRALTEALKSLARQLGLDDTQVVINRLRQGDQSLWNDFHYKLSAMVAEQLGILDQDIKAVFIDEYDVNPEDLAFGEAARTTVLYLIVWVQCKGVALKALVKALDQAMVQCFQEQIGQPRLRHLLEVGVMDDTEARNSVGYGALLASTHFPLTEVWRRQGANLDSI